MPFCHSYEWAPRQPRSWNMIAIALHCRLLPVTGQHALTGVSGTGELKLRPQSPPPRKRVVGRRKSGRPNVAFPLPGLVTGLLCPDGKVWVVPARIWLQPASWSELPPSLEQGETC